MVSTSSTSEASNSTSEVLVGFDEVLKTYDPAFGLEVHVELNTATKMFCGCPTVFGGEPNTQVCPTCLGLPGSMPAVNGKAIESAIKIGLALNCEIAEWCRFARKNYFYPDMPKNFQTSQYDEPIAFNGYLDITVADEAGEGQAYRIEIERAHMEEDTGKATHVGGATGRIHGADHSLIDYNRAGIPLIEIVTRPVLGAGERAPDIAKAYVAALRDLVEGLGVSDVRMDQGSMRCDVNLSLAPKGSGLLGTRTETKNVNSLRSVERAVRFEMSRQAGILNAGGKILQETRHFHEDTATTSPGREKSDAEDYRYFPEPDLVPIAPSRTWVEEVRATLPEPPSVRRARLQGDWGFSDLEMRDAVAAGVLGTIEKVVGQGVAPQPARKWAMEFAEADVAAADIAAVQKKIDDGELTDKLARQVFEGLFAGEGSVDEVIAKRGLAVADDSILEAAVDAAIAAQPEVVAKIQGGNLGAVGALMGAVMKATGGKVDAAKARELIVQKLS